MKTQSGRDRLPFEMNRLQLTDRIVLNPFAAKRLSFLLNKTMSEYEKRFGALDIGPVSEGRA